jgi:hypothetical protein
MQDQAGETKKIAGMMAQAASIVYPDSTVAHLYYTPDWYPTKPVIFEHLPGTKVLLLEFTYDSQKGRMHFVAESITANPVENSIFHIPSDCKMISYEEYLQLLN